MQGDENAVCILRLVGLRICLVVMQSCGMHAILRSFKFKRNETETNKRKTNVFSSDLCSAPCFAVRFICQFVIWRMQLLFCEVNCSRVLAKPRRQVQVQDRCMIVSCFDAELMLHGLGNA